MRALDTSGAITPKSRRRVIGLLVCFIFLQVAAQSQSKSRNRIPIDANDDKNPATQVPSAEEQRRTFAVSIVNTLAIEGA